MTPMSIDDCQAWCNRRGVAASKKQHLDFIGDSHLVELALPRIGRDCVGLSNILSTQLEGDHHPETLLWLTEYGMWSDSYETVGIKLWTQMFRGYGYQQESIRPTEGLLFAEAETDDQRAFLSIPLILQWDAALVPVHGKYLVRMTHHGQVQFKTKDDALAKSFADIVEAWKRGG